MDTTNTKPGLSQDILGLFADNAMGRAYIKHILSNKLDKQLAVPLEEPKGFVEGAVRGPRLQKAINEAFGEWYKDPNNQAKLSKAIPHFLQGSH